MMNKNYLIALFIALILFAGTAFSYSVYETQLKQILINPESFDRLPDDLTPYCCGQVVDGHCNTKVDIERAALDIKKGLSPSAKYEVTNLNCGGS